MTRVAAGAFLRHKCVYLGIVDPTVSTTGTSQRGRLFLEFLADRYDVHLVHMEDRDGEGRDEALRARLRSAVQAPYGKWPYFLFSARLYAALDAAVRRTSPDFIFADFEKAGLYAWLASRRHGVPYVYSSHNVEHRRYVDVASTSWMRYPLVPWIWLAERQGCRGAALTVAISEPDARLLSVWTPPERLLTLPCAFDELVLATPRAPSTNRPVVLMVGNYRNPGNREGALLAFRRILPETLKSRPDAIFRFVGKHLPAEIRHANVDAAGFVDDLNAEYAGAACVIAPITIGGGIKIKVVEALAAGRPLIATPKAMEGIPSEGLGNLSVAEPAAFPRLIVDALDRRPEPATRNRELMAERFGARRQLESLGERIDALLAARGAAANASSVRG